MAAWASSSRASPTAAQPVAIKVVTTELSQDEVFVRRFQREVAAAQKISHPHVVPVLGAGDEGGLPYLVQELIPGGSLHDRLVGRRARSTWRRRSGC